MDAKEIINFILDGGSFCSKEGVKIINSSEISTLIEAAKEKNVRDSILEAFKNCPDPGVKGKLFLTF